MKRTVLNLQQGTPEWLAARANSDGTASEAPAMFGKSKYQTRLELLDQRKTGLSKEVTSATQAIFDKGHEAEASARKIAEEIIGEELSPTTYMVEVDGLRLMASLDGITFGDDVIFEHKLWNESLAQQVSAGELEEHYTIQMDQELLASGAAKCLFMVSNGTRDKCVFMWYETTDGKATALVNGWHQFHKELETHVPTVKVEKVEAETIKALPVPSVVVRGEITASNLTEITPQFDTYLESIKTELSTDQDFADAEANAKNCREMAKRIEALQENIIGQMVTVNEANGVLGNYKEAFNKVGLRLEKAVKEQKETLKTQAIMKAKLEYADFVTALNKDISVVLSTQLVCPDFAAAIKGVKTLETMQSRINSALANGKVEATTLANDVKTKIAFIEESIKGYEHLFKIDAIVFSNIDYIKLHIQSVKDAEDVRKAKHEAAIKEQAEADARAKIEAEAKAKEAAEIAAAKAQADAATKSAAENQAQDHIASAGKQIPDGDAITNDTINQADFNNVFGVKEQPAVQVGSVRPTAQSIINLVAKTYNVDTATANRWLAQSFGELKAA
ncbi:YqaJ viral recombinase family protein [Methylotenera sp.]|uniref:YqaJ viral recombinase family protein n=1 Tax=Methylotenera sp. TaxID=2051956 RepID=UPI002EDB1C15